MELAAELELTLCVLDVLEELLLDELDARLLDDDFNELLELELDVDKVATMLEE
jgi:hypothetical protein